MMKPHIGEIIFFFIMFSVVGYFALVIMSPYLSSLFLAGVLAVLFMPIFRKTNFYIHDKGKAAFVTVFVVLLGILIPLSLLGFLMFEEVVSIYGTLSDSNIGIQIVNVWIDQIQSLIRNVIPSFTIQTNVYGYIETVLKWVAQHLNEFFSGVLAFFFDIILIIAAMFFFYRDGDKLKAFALKWSPLANEYDESIIARLEGAVASVMKGALLTASAQGLLVGIGFAVFGVPNPVLWGAIATIAALVPMFGTTIITIPGVLFLYAFGNVGAAIGLLIWSVLCVGLVDNILHPLLVNRGMHIHPFLILLSVFGGLVYFGLIGFIAGPVIMAFFFTLLDVYPSIIKGRAVSEK